MHNHMEERNMNMNVIYEPRGRAREYSPFAANLYAGCTHGCVYCYAPAATRKTREQFSTAAARKNIRRLLVADCKTLQRTHDTRPILLCFTCDPYQPIDERVGLTRFAVHTILEHGLNVRILTKGGKRSMRDFDLFAAHSDRCEYGTTLTLLDEEESKQWEPHAAPPHERIHALKKAHALGIPTWVSLEPVIDPDATLAIIERTHSYVDRYAVGTLNHHPHASHIDWGRFARDVVDKLEEVGANYYLKRDLRRYLREVVV